MRVLIVEDEPLSYAQLQQVLEAAPFEIEIVGHLETKGEVVEFLRNRPALDVILSDIRLLDGVVFDAFSEVDVEAPVVFITAFDMYALRAFKYNAVDYLLKPVIGSELYAVLHKVKAHQIYSRPSDKLLWDAMRNHGTRFRQRFVINEKDGFHAVMVSEVSHIKTEKGCTLVVLKDGSSAPVDLSLDELEKQLDPAVFFRANRQYIVAVDSIADIKTSLDRKLKIRLKAAPSELVAVSRDRSQALRQWMDS